MQGWIQYSMLSGTCLYSLNLLISMLVSASFYVAVRQDLSIYVERWLLEIPGIDYYTFIPSRERLIPRTSRKGLTTKPLAVLGLCPALRLSLCSNDEMPNWPDMVPWVGGPFHSNHMDWKWGKVAPQRNYGAIIRGRGTGYRTINTIGVHYMLLYS